MRHDCYLGMRPGDLDGKPYAKYWRPDMAPLSEPATQAILEGPVSSDLGFVHEQAGQLLEPGYLPLETGYTRLDNGQLFVAVLTPMPGVTGAMIDWWFAWHGAEKERYKLWHPRAHMRATMDKKLSEVSNLTDRQKYVGNISYVDEYIGCTYHRVSIAFRPPGENYLDESKFKQANVATAVCARVGFMGRPVDFARLIHLIRETEQGCEMRSRFWLGDVEIRSLPKRGLLNRLLGSRAVAKRAAEQAMARDLLVHCAMEMQHLAGFLPDLYRDYHAGEPVLDSHRQSDSNLHSVSAGEQEPMGRNSVQRGRC